jgi:hypothetical protein
MPSATSPQPERSQFARADAIGSRLLGRGGCEGTPLHTARGRLRVAELRRRDLAAHVGQLSALTDPDGNTISLIGGSRVRY